MSTKWEAVAWCVLTIQFFTSFHPPILCTCGVIECLISAFSIFSAPGKQLTVQCPCWMKRAAEVEVLQWKQEWGVELSVGVPSMPKELFDDWNVDHFVGSESVWGSLCLYAMFQFYNILKWKLEERQAYTSIARKEESPDSPFGKASWSMGSWAKNDID